MIVFIIVLVCVGSVALYGSGMLEDNTTQSTESQVKGQSKKPTALNKSCAAPDDTEESVTTSNDQPMEQGKIKLDSSKHEEPGEEPSENPSEVYARKKQPELVGADSAKSKYVFGPLVTNEMNKLPNAELTRRAVPREGIDAYRLATSTMHVTSTLSPRGTANERPNDGLKNRLGLDYRRKNKHKLLALLTQKISEDNKYVHHNIPRG